MECGNKVKSNAIGFDWAVGQTKWHVPKNTMPLFCESFGSNQHEKALILVHCSLLFISSFFIFTRTCQMTIFTKQGPANAVKNVPEGTTLYRKFISCSTFPYISRINVRFFSFLWLEILPKTWRGASIFLHLLCGEQVFYKVLSLRWNQHRYIHVGKRTIFFF